MRIHKLLFLACLAAFTQPTIAADAPTTPGAPTGNQTVVSVNGVAIDAVQAEIVRMDLAQRKRPATDDHVRSFLVDNELMAQEAIKRGLDQTVEVKALLDLQRKDILGKALVDDFIKKNPVADERVKAEYEQIKARTGTMEYHPRHILVEDEKLAKDIIAKLTAKKPLKFEDLAKKHSKDSSAQAGGDLGWLAPNNLVPEFADAMVKLKKGDLTKTPVKTQFGWHVIKLDDSRQINFPELDKVKGRIAGQLAQQDLRKYLGELRATAKIDIPAAK
mgnify:CR=1 FL=1